MLLKHACLRAIQVALEFCVVNEKDFSLTGTVRVWNISFHKNVTVVFSSDHWKTKNEVG
jgi:hypothetical protein